MSVEDTLLESVKEEDFQTEDADTSVDTQEPEAQSQKFERPPEVPVEFWDEDSGTFKGQDLYNAYKKEQERALGLRQKLSKGLPVPPKSAEEYRFVNSEGKEIEISEEDNEDAKNFRKLAFDVGLTQEQFSKLATQLGQFAGDEAKTEEELKLEAEEYQREELKKLGPRAGEIVRDLTQRGVAFVKNGVLSQQDYKVYESWLKSAEDIRVMQNILSSYEPSIPIEVRGDVEGMSEEEAQRLMNHPDYEIPGSEIHKKVTQYYQRAYG